MFAGLATATLFALPPPVRSRCFIGWAGWMVDQYNDDIIVYRFASFSDAGYGIAQEG